MKAIDLLPYSENTVDNRFYIRGSLSYEVKADEVVGTYAQTAKDNDDLKNKMIEQDFNYADSTIKEMTDLE